MNTINPIINQIMKTNAKISVIEFCGYAIVTTVASAFASLVCNWGIFDLLMWDWDCYFFIKYITYTLTTIPYAAYVVLMGILLFVRKDNNEFWIAAILTTIIIAMIIGGYLWTNGFTEYVIESEEPSQLGLEYGYQETTVPSYVLEFFAKEAKVAFVSIASFFVAFLGKYWWQKRQAKG